MRVRATATGSSESNAIGQLELSCTPGGLSLGLYGVGAYSEGYATGALTMGTRFTVPYAGIRVARVQEGLLYLELDAPGLPHSRLTLTRFTAGPGVPPLELKRRRLILHFTALSVAAIACLAGTILAPSRTHEALAWGALGYGALAGAVILALGFSLDQRLLLRPPGEAQCLEAFVSELQLHYPKVLRSGAPPPRKKLKPLPNLSAFLPRTTAAIGMTLAATVLTALVAGQRLLMDGGKKVVKNIAHPVEAEAPIARSMAALTPSPTPAHPESDQSPSRNHQVPSGGLLPTSPESEGVQERASIERHCLCERAASPLWSDPIPRLSAVLIERRAIQLKSYIRSQLQLAVVNNGDAPVDEITLHVQFYERKGKSRIPTKERPLYFEGPLMPGEAIKWKTEARGTEFEVSVPDLGNLGPNGAGAAKAEDFKILLKANHRPVRMHAARMLSYLGDEAAREAALQLKDAMRAAEAPYIRRILAATGNTRVCDIELPKEGSKSVGVCVYNASDQDLEGLGVQLNDLSGALNVDHPLAAPPSLLASEKWLVGEKLGAHSGRYISVALPDGFLSDKKGRLEIIADRYDLLD